MGVTFRSPNRRVDMGYGSFFRFRQKIASFAPKEIAEHYAALVNINPLDRTSYPHYAEKAEHEYDHKTVDLYQKYKRNWGWLFDFLYAPDCDGHLTVAQCRKLLMFIRENFDPYEKIGYTGRPDCSTVRDFTEMLDDAVTQKKQVRWS